MFRRSKGFAVECSPIKDPYRAGESLVVRVTIHNQRGEERALLAMGVPWLAHQAIEFDVKAPPGFEPVYSEGLPREGEPVPIPAHGSISGEVDVSRYVKDASGKPLGGTPGLYRIRAKLKTFATVPDPTDMIVIVSPHCALRVER
jgi:hypothetical protein